MMVMRAMGSAAEDRISRIAQAMISSSRVMPASRVRLLCMLRCFMTRFTLARFTAGKLLHADGGLAGNQRDGLLLGVLGVHLNDGNIGRAGRERLYNDTEQSAAAVYAGSIGLACGGNNSLPVLLIHTLHDGNFLCSA